VRKYAIRRVIDSLVTLFLIIVANFFLFRLIPGDPIRMMAKVQRLRPEAVERLQKLYGLHLPMWQQFFLYVRNLFTFQFGLSIKYMVEAAPLIFEKLWNSILLLTISGLLALIIGTVLGLISGWHRGKAGDISMVSASLFFWCMPTFWISMVFAATFVGILPISGMTSLPPPEGPLYMRLLDLGRHLLLPTIVMTILYLGEMLLIARNEVTNIVTQDYITTARAKGLKAHQIISRHVLRNASLPLISNAALSLAFIAGGALQTEIIFNWPGIGRLMYDAVLARDYPVLQGSFYIMSVAILVANVLTDITYKFIDPRVEY